MPRCVLNQMRIRLGLYNQLVDFGSVTLYCQRKAFCSSGSNSDENDIVKNQPVKSIGQTTVLVQRGCTIQELPTTLRNFRVEDLTDANVSCITLNNNTTEAFPSLSTTTTNDEVVTCLKNSSTTSAILNAIHNVPYAHLTAEMSARALERLIKIETIIGMQNLEDSSLVYENIIKCIIQKGDTRTILDFLETLKTSLDLKRTIQRFCDELLMRNSDGMLGIVEICECIEVFTDCKQQSAAERLWTGIANDEEKINDLNIKFVYKILPHLKVTQRLVVGVLERRILDVWLQLKPMTVTASIRALSKADISPHRTMHCFARWLNINIHAITESELRTIIQGFSKLNFSNIEIEKALERYMKGKGFNVRQESLFLAALEHAKKFRLRNNLILNGCIEFFMRTPNKFSRNFFQSLITTLGALNFQPPNGNIFWRNAETYFSTNFSKIHPRNVIELLLNFCYLKRFPTNLATTVLNPNYLDLLQNAVMPDEWRKIRDDLKLFDATLALEIDTYSGPFLAIQRKGEVIVQDGRIERTTDEVRKHLEEILSEETNLSKAIQIDKLPENSLYIADILIKSSESDGNAKKSDSIAILIMLPEYYDSLGNFLIGPQAMRIRHIEMIGMRVVSVNYEEVIKLRNSPKQLRQYLIEKIRNYIPSLKC